MGMFHLLESITDRNIISRLEPNTEYCIPNNSTTHAAETSPTI